MTTAGSLAVLSCLLGFASFPQSTGSHQDATELLRQAQQFLGQKDYQQARLAASRALQLDPASAAAENLVGTAEFGLGNLAVAGAHFRRALEIDPHFVRAHRSLGAVYLKQKLLEEAGREFQAVLTAYPDDFIARYSLGLTLLLQHQPAQALPQFEKASALDRNDPAPLMGALQAQLELKQAGPARAVLRELDNRLAPRDPRRLQLAFLLTQHGSYDLAIPEFERLRAAAPDNYDINYNLALAYHRTGKQSEAAAVLETMLARHQSAELRDLLAEVEASRGNHTEALQSYRRAAELEPRNEDYRFNYAEALVSSGSLDAALQEFAAATRDFPSSTRMWLGYGTVCYLKGNYQEAAQTFLHATDVAPRAPEAYYLLGRAYDASGPRQEEISRRLQLYLETAPRDPWAHLFYGRILASPNSSKSQKDLTSAQRHLETAVRLADSFAEAHFELGKVLEAQGELASSRRELERAVALDPKLSAAYYKLGQVYQRLGDPAQATKAFQQFQQAKAHERAGPEREKLLQVLRQARK